MGIQEIVKKADVLIEALPYIQNFYEKTIVIKYGGAAMTDPNIRREVLEDIVFMNYVGMRPLLVHGGGPFISKRLTEIGKEPKFVKGFRVTDHETMEIVEEELSKVNRDIVKEVLALGGSAISLSGNEDHLIRVFRDIAPGDWALGGWRFHYQCLLKGVPPAELKAAIRRGDSMSLAFPEHRILCSAIVGGILPIAVGIAVKTF